MCTRTAPARLHLAMAATAPARARAFVEQAVCAVHDAQVLQAAQLLVSELVTNAVAHGAPPITVEVECDGSTELLVRVHDEGTDHPRHLQVGAQEQGGRGIALVDLISTAWGVEPAAQGKAVWFRLRRTS